MAIALNNVRLWPKADIQPQRHQTKISLVSVYGQAPCLSESCPENGNLPKSPLLYNWQPGAFGGHKIELKNNFGFSGGRPAFCGASNERAP